ncbi:MAG: pitrilysin family protein, partial [Candidatus Omnitrophota bacterium]|nr:pitrilysin family protein [Candidatus Omnitrophota bacterium]
TLYVEHPYRHPIIGYPELFAQVSRDELYGYYKENYIPNNIVLSIAGNVKTQEILAQVEKAFGEIPPKPYLSVVLPQEPPQISPRRYEEEYPTNTTRFMMAFPTIELIHPDLYALDVLAQILGQGESSRLYRDIYQKQGLVYGISAYSHTPSRGPGAFAILGELEYPQLEQTIAAAWQHIDRLNKEGVSNQELQKARKQAISDFVLGKQTTESVAYSQALDEAFTGDFRFSEEYVKGIQSVTLAKIKEVANKYLIPSAVNITVLKPKSGEKEVVSQAQDYAVEPIEKHVLSNGLTVLLRQDKTFPAVSMRVTLGGGLRQEHAQMNGISQIMSLTWTKGTARHSAPQISQIVDQLGMSLDSFSGKNSFGLSITCLKEDWSPAFNLMEELVKKPIFPEQEIQKIKDILIPEIKQPDSIFSFSSRELKKLIFPDHPYGLDEKGTLTSLPNIHQEDIQKFYAMLMSPDNMIISVFGDIDPSATFKQIERRFGSLPLNPVTLFAQKPAPITAQEKSLDMDRQQALVIVGFQGASLANEDQYGLEVLSQILGSAFNGRLFNDVREQLGQAYVVGGASIPGIETGLIYLYAMTAPSSAEQVKNLILEAIRNVQNEPVGEKELTDIKKYLKGNAKIDLQTNAALSLTTSLDELYGKGFEHYQQYDRFIDQVTAAQLQHLAQQYLDLTKAVIVVTTPPSANR